MVRDDTYQNQNWWDKVPDAVTSNVLDVIGFRSYMQLLFDSPIRDRGWFRSFGGAPIDQRDEPIPWMPYCFIDFIEPRLSRDLSIFEFGSGNSTRYFAERVNDIVSVEHNDKWFNKIEPELPKNATLYHRSGDEYIQEIKQHGEFDIVIIDGKRRVDSVKNSLDSLTNSGVIIWDDTFRGAYDSGKDYLIENGFRELYFQGMGPVTANLQRTSIFYRDSNCLDV